MCSSRATSACWRWTKWCSIAASSRTMISMTTRCSSISRMMNFSTLLVTVIIQICLSGTVTDGNSTRGLHVEGSSIEAALRNVDAPGPSMLKRDGVVGLITPWNYPLQMATWKIASALATGCTAVIKPSELASMTCLELTGVCQEVDLPSCVLHIVTGLGPDAGASVAAHPDVDKVSFTWSSAGHKIMTAATKRVKLVSLEHGGKSPIAVSDDVEITTEDGVAMVESEYTSKMGIIHLIVIFFSFS